MKKKIILFSSLFFLVDLISKSIIKNTLNLYQKIEVIPSFFRITYVINDGAAFSILKGQQIFFIISAYCLCFWTDSVL